jgi:aryl-alcohol dehydrogenase-like predicted oxidoreductase/enamine deaminase RidA (YjgF/YER057c/UK114 family)
MPAVERWPLAPGLTISRVLTGLWQVADMERDGRTIDLDHAAAAMGPYIEAGLTTFDMADHYGSAELVAGRSAGESPHGIQLLTKWVPRPGPVTRDLVRAAVGRALDRLRRPALDLLQFHAWSYADPAWLDALFFLEELREEGLIRHLGLTNFDTAHLRVARASGMAIVSNQVSFSLLDQRARHRMAPFCREHGVTLLAYGTLAGGWLCDRWLGQPEPDWERTGTWSQMKYGRFIRAAGGWEALQGVLRAAAKVAARHKVSIANVASRFALEEPGIGGVIIGARLGEREHVADNLRLFQFTLTQADREELNPALAALDPIPGDCGDEYRRPPFLTATGDLSHHTDGFPAPYEVRGDPGGRRYCLSGTPWESIAGYARAVRVGNRVAVSGTTASHGGRLIGGTDPAAQAHFAVDKIEGALQSLGARLDDVVRTRTYVSSMVHWEPVSRALGERFGAVRPAATLVEARLVDDTLLVEIEADAEATQPDPLRRHS